MRRWMHRVKHRLREFNGKKVSASFRVLTFVQYFLLMSLTLFQPTPVGASQEQIGLDLSIPAIRSSYVEHLAGINRAARTEAEIWALEYDFPIWHDDGINVFRLMYLRNNRPVYYITENVNAAISTATDKVRNTAPHNLDGSGITVGLWDASGVLTTHQEFGSRIQIMDRAVPPNDHATHVAGTIGAVGIERRAQGMAPGVRIDSYDFEGDTEEMAQRGAAFAGEQDKIYLSNHSYGPSSGWIYTDLSGNEGWHWFSSAWNGPDSTADLFGQYDQIARQWDELAYGAPYYLIFIAAGNHRNDNPSPQEQVYYWSGNQQGWQHIPYSARTCPPGDGIVKKGYDTIAGKAVAKNAMTVGSVADAVNRNHERNLSNARMSSFSSWGPADDGRIKPDIVANGDNLFSPLAASNSSYTDQFPFGWSGTSMSSPNACGSAALLVQYYNELFEGQSIRSSTLKGLIIHTADDLGRPGPDYSYGWGLMNTEAAAQVIKQHHENPSAQRIIEGSLLVRNRIHNYIINADGTGPIRVTLCWTDPPAGEISRHDDTSPRLVNDLDLRVFGPDGSVFYPFVLDPTEPSAPATTGDNTLDNMEQVIIEAPSNGSYTVRVSYKGILKIDEQFFSLILTGISAPGAPSAPTHPVPTDGASDVSVDTILSWNANDVINSFELQDDLENWVTWFVFLGISPDALELICEDRSEPVCDPGKLNHATTYHWQVLAKNDTAITHGPIWSFTTQSP